MTHNTFRHIDALEYADAWNSCDGLDIPAIESKARALNVRMDTIEQRGDEIPSYLLAAYRAYESAIILRRNPSAFSQRVTNMNDQEFKRLRAKLKNFPPYDWEDDVEMLLTEIDRYIGEAAHWQAQCHKHHLDHINMTIAIDALTRISTTASGLEDPTIMQIARRALLTIQGER